MIAFPVKDQLTHPAHRDNANSRGLPSIIERHVGAVGRHKWLGHARRFDQFTFGRRIPCRYQGANGDRIEGRQYLSAVHEMFLGEVAIGGM